MIEFRFEVFMKADVIDFVTFGDAEDRVEFLEQVTMHLKECNFDDSKDHLRRKLNSMVNLIAPRKLIMVTKSDQDRKKPTGRHIILTEFILPGIMNKMA
jgi:hypothetical protein